VNQQCDETLSNQDRTAVPNESALPFLDRTDQSDPTDPTDCKF